MSDYRPRSELSRLCDRAGGPPVVVSEELFRVLSRATELSCLTEGAVDVTVAPLVGLWRTARETGRFPPRAELDAARQLVGWHRVHLDPERRTVRLPEAGLRLDLGGVAKGYAVQAAVEVLREKGLPRCLVDLGGDLALGEPPPGRKGWRVQLFDAQPDAELLLLSDTVVCASGDTEQFVEIEGKRYSHIVDPRTGIGATSRTMAAVVARDGLLADGLATAVCVLGREEGLRIAKRFTGVSVYVRSSADSRERDEHAPADVPLVDIRQPAIASTSPSIV